MSTRAAALTVACIALSTDLLVYGMAIPVLPALATAEGIQPWAVGVLFASFAAALIVATPFVGWWIDRAGTRSPMLLGLLGLGASTLLFAFSHTFMLLLLARVLQGIAGAVSWVAGLALIAATHPAEVRGRAMGAALSLATAGFLIGPPLAGVLYQHFGQPAPFLAAAAVAFADGAARWLLIPAGRGDDEGRASRALPRDPRLPLVAILVVLGAALLGFLEPILPLHLTRSLGTSPAVVGLVFGGAVLASAAATPVSGAAADRGIGLPVAALGLLLGSAALLAMAWLTSLWAITLALVVVAVGGSAVLAPTLALMAEFAESGDPPAFGAAYGIYNLVFAVGLTVGPAAAAAVFQAAGFRGAAAAGGVTIMVVGVAIAAFMRVASRALGNDAVERT
ncbi:MAG TPA: MFS transporter [Candidatus Sulfotelmatobacter sp.]|nr:MFS transporter [Candidatus Sulfotelmatobacter sp.]